MLHYLSFELNRLRRDPKFVLLTLLIPSALYLMISTIHIPGPMTNANQTNASAMIGMACYSVLMVTVTNGINIALDRSIGWVSQLRTTPLRAWAVVVGKLSSGLLLSSVAVGLMFLIGAFVQDVRLSPGLWVTAGAIVWGGSFIFGLLGFGLGYLASPTSGGPLVMATVVGLSILGGLWVPMSFFPDTVQHIAKALPTYRWAHLSQGLVLHQSNLVPDLLIFGAWTVGFGLFAVAAYRRGALKN